MPKNITLIFLPSRSPELNPVENIWQYRELALQPGIRKLQRHRRGHLRGLERLAALPETITSIGMRQWAHVGVGQRP